MNSQLRELHDQLHLHKPSIKDPRAATDGIEWCSECKSLITNFHDLNGEWISLHHPSARKIINRYDYKIRMIAASISEEDKKQLVDDAKDLPELCRVLLETKGYDRKILLPYVAKSKTELNKLIRYDKLSKEEMQSVKSVSITSPRIAYNTLRVAHNTLSKEEIDIAMASILKSACYSFKYAFIFNKKSDELRIASSKQPLYAFKYARYIDYGPHDITRKGACGKPAMAYAYARMIDKCEHPDTIAAVLNDPLFAYEYAKKVSKRDVPELRKAVSKDKYYENRYINWFSDKIYRNM